MVFLAIVTDVRDRIVRNVGDVLSGGHIRAVLAIVFQHVLSHDKIIRVEHPGCAARSASRKRYPTEFGAGS